jgi:hypothetical protein
MAGLAVLLQDRRDILGEGQLRVVHGGSVLCQQADSRAYAYN